VPCDVTTTTTAITTTTTESAWVNVALASADAFAIADYNIIE